MNRLLICARAGAEHGALAGRAVRSISSTCRVDTGKQEIMLQSKRLTPGADFFAEVADEKAMADAEKYAKNIESYVGTVKIPVGIVGPVKIITEGNKEMDLPPHPPNLHHKDHYIPLATTEHGVVADYARGARATFLSGGVTAAVVKRQMTRAPVFCFERVLDATRFLHWFNTSGFKKTLVDMIQSQQSHSHHRSLADIEVIQTYNRVHLKIAIASCEASESQDVLINSGRLAIEAVLSAYRDSSTRGITDAYVKGGFNSGRRGSSVHLHPGKGFYTVADCVLPFHVVKDVLKSTPDLMVAYHRQHQSSGMFLNSLSNTAQVARGLAAFYTANGMDLSCIAESQAGVTYLEVRDREGDIGGPSLYAAVTLPSLMVSMPHMRAGTSLPSQKANIGLIGAHNPEEMACVLAGCLLGGELSYYAALGMHFRCDNKGGYVSNVARDDDEPSNYGAADRSPPFDCNP